MGDRRRCESCGSVMPPRMHRQVNDEGKKVCQSCIRMKRPTWAALTATRPMHAPGEQPPTGWKPGYHTCDDRSRDSICPACDGLGWLPKTRARSGKQDCIYCDNSGIVHAPGHTSAVQTDGNPDYDRGYTSGYHGSDKLPGQSDEYNAGYAAGKAAQVTASKTATINEPHCTQCGRTDAESVFGGDQGYSSCCNEPVNGWCIDGWCGHGDRTATIREADLSPIDRDPSHGTWGVDRTEDPSKLSDDALEEEMRHAWFDDLGTLKKWVEEADRRGLNTFHRPQQLDGTWSASLHTGRRKVAHDSGDGETIYHCPFCGAGSVVGSSSGTVSCQFCKTNFTVQVQPEFKAMPQTINGQPYNMPGMPGGGPDAGAAPQQQAADQGAAQDGAPPAPKPADGNDLNAKFEQAVGGAPQPDAAPRPTGAPPARPSVAASYVVDGVTLTAKAYHQRLALRSAEDREAVLAAIRQENAR